MIRVAVVTFPGSNDDRDAMRAVKLLGGEPVSVWHADSHLAGADAVVLPGGFAYGDYLRTGAIARFAPAMRAVEEFAEAGGPVLGICNGFQILCEARLLPGALIRNRELAFICRRIHLRPEAPGGGGRGRRGGDGGPREAGAGRGGAGRPGGQRDGGFEVLEMPIKHGEGQFIAPTEELERIEREGLVAYRYCSPDGEVDEPHNSNGSAHAIAGIRNDRGNVLGLMPHPEHAVDPDLGPTGGRHVFEWLFTAARAPVPA